MITTKPTRGVNKDVVPQLTIELTPAERKLLGYCQQTRFGSIFGLRIVGGQPTFDPAPRIRRSLRLSEKYVTSEPNTDSFALRDKHRLLFQVFRDMVHGTIAEIQVRNGLPESVSIEEEAG